MKEQFTRRLLSGNFKIKCKNDDGSFRIWEGKKQDVVKHIVQIVNQYEDMGYKLTLRQLHYQLVSNNWIVNHQTAYKKLGAILDDCRYAGVIDWDSIEDRGRVPKLTYWVHDIPNALQDTIDSYRLDRQKGQKLAIELWTEKDALSGILGRSTHKYHIRLVVNKGYTSSSAVYEAYERIIQNYGMKHQRTIILYFGDHDPSGLDMIRDISERLSFMLANGQYKIKDPSILFEVVQIGLNIRQVRQYKLPPNPTKMTDSRSGPYIEEFGNECWEVDALKPDILTSIVETNIEELLDLELYKDMITQENADIALLNKDLKKYLNKK